jgi:hypothetical protein
MILSDTEVPLLWVFWDETEAESEAKTYVRYEEISGRKKQTLQ